MSGSGARKRKEVDALRAAKLAAQGWTHREIADALNKLPEHIKLLIVLGERFKEKP